MYCSKCGTKLQEDTSFCSKCGSPVADPPETSKLPRSQSPAQRDSAEQKKSWLISLPAYIISLIALIGSASALFLGQQSPQGGLALCFWCGVTAGILGKRRNRSGLVWFFIGLIPIGFSLYFILVFLKTILLRQ